MPLVQMHQLAKVLNLKPRRVFQLVSDEGMPKAAHGQYDLLKCVSWYIQFLQRAIDADTTGGGDASVNGLVAQRTRQAREQAERMSMDNAELRGNLMRWDEAKTLVTLVQDCLQRAVPVMLERFNDDPALRARIEREHQAIAAGLAARFEDFARRVRRMPPSS